MLRATHILLAIAVAALPSHAHAADDEGKLAFNNHCRVCHSIHKEDNRLGPSIIGIFGSRAGQSSGYRSYSGSLKDFVWDESKLDAFITNPVAVAPGTTMNYPPVADPAIRAKIISFLKSTSSP